MQKQINPWLPPLLLIAAIGLFFLFGQQRPATYQRDNGFIFGTTYHITYSSDSSLHAGILKQLERVDSSLSMFNSESTLSHINRNEPVHPDSMLLRVFALAQTISEHTDGAFDITVAPLVNAWGFGFSNSDHPTPESVDSLMEITGYEKVWTDGSDIIKADSRIMLDCSAIAKGYACDVVAHYLRTQGVHNFMVEIGGEIIVSGENDKGRLWSIGVNKPTDDSLAIEKDLQEIIAVSNVAMATSGNYRNFYYRDGKRYAHTIDPRTGYPVQHNILSATVLAPSCAMADAYATAFMVVGLDGTKEILAQHPEIEAYLICDDTIWHSPTFSRHITNN